MGTHEYEEDPRNEDVLISVNGELFPRKKRRFRSSTLDSFWEMVSGNHLGSMMENWCLSKNIWTGFSTGHRRFPDPGRSRDEIRSEINRVISANEMHDGVHLRLIVSRGLKPTPYQAPWVISSKPTIVIIPNSRRPTKKVNRWH